MKKTVPITGLMIALSLFLTNGAMAKEYVSTPLNWEGQLQKFTGRIEKVDLSQKEVTIQSGPKTIIFFTDNKTILSDWTQKIPFSGIKDGMWATVEYTHDGGQMVARWIDVANSQAALEERAELSW